MTGARAVLRRAKRFLLGDEWERAYGRLREPKTRAELTLDEPAIHAALAASPIPCEQLTLDPAEYWSWRKAADYDRHHPGYYDANIHEKTLEHFVSAKLLALKPGEVFIDVASQNGVAAEVFERLHGVKAYAQDLDFEPGLHGRRIGGNAAKMAVENGFADAMALHCSFEHFEGDSDVLFVGEAERVLRPGGRCVVAPLYLCHRYSCITDPLLSAGTVEFEPDIQLHAMRHWHNRHGRFYDVPHLVARIWERRRSLRIKVLTVPNYREIDPSCYLRFVLLLEKPA